MKNGILLSIISFLFLSIGLNAQTAYTEMRDITGLEIAAEMAPGVNLWNSLDAYASWIPIPHGVDESQTCWGNPLTTPEMVQDFADRGFKTLRIPTTWYNHMVPGEDWIIDTAWMDRVEEVVNYVLDAGMYAIVNLHHEDYNESHKGSWLVPTYEKEEEVTVILEKIWVQVATRFKDYGDYLILETMNEPREVGSSDEWNGGSSEHRDVINKYNLAAVNTIRGTGGNNAHRFILIPQVGANVVSAMEDMIIPNNDTNIIVSTHAYSPYSFCLQSVEAGGSDVWGTDAEISSLQNDIKALSDHFVANGQAVIMGEWGADDKDNYADRVTYYNTYAKACKDGGITPIAWIYSYNRNDREWTEPMIEDAILKHYNEDAIEVEDFFLSIDKDTIFVGETLKVDFSVEPVTAVSPTQYIWTSYDKDVAKVDNDGLVTGLAKGKAKISATVIGGKADCYVWVVDTTTSVNENLLEKDINIFPNPVRDQLTIQLTKGESEISLYALDGKQLLFIKTSENEVSLNMNEYEVGTYILSITSGNNRVTRKVLVE